MAVRRLINKCKNYFFPYPDLPPFLHICQIGGPVLRRKAEAVPPEEISSDKIQKIIKNMLSALKSYDCYGISAPQIGIPLRIIALHCSPKDVKKVPKEIREIRQVSVLPLTVVINPIMKVTHYKLATFPEGCQSIRGYCADTPRYKAVDIHGLDPFGEKIAFPLFGWSARIAQHEMDHLDGTLYIDKMDGKTFENTAWDKINVYKGRISIDFMP